MKEMVYGKRELLHYEEFGDYNIVIVSLGSHPCAYIKLPIGIGRKFAEKWILDIAGGNNFEIECELCIDREPHGGFTYFGARPHKDVPDGYYVGWDYNHYSDYAYYGYDILPDSPGKQWTTEEIYEEAKEVLENLKEYFEGEEWQ